MTAEEGTWRPGGGGGEVAFTREELELALRPHLDEERAAAEAATIAATLRDAGVAGVVLSDDVLAMLAVTSIDLAERVAAYRSESLERRRAAWLRREQRSLLDRTDVGAAERELEARWRAAAAEEARTWVSLLERVRLAVEQKAVRQAGAEGGLVRLEDRRRS